MIDPETKVSVQDRARAYLQVNGPAGRREDARAGDLRLAALGSGSDYTPFLQHLGVASLNIGYGGEDGGGSYHSIYDSFDHYTALPGIRPSITAWRWRNSAGAPSCGWPTRTCCPSHAPSLAETVARYATEVQKLADDLREQTEEENRKVRERLYELAADPKLALVAPKAKEGVPFLPSLRCRTPWPGSRAAPRPTRSPRPSRGCRPSPGTLATGPASAWRGS